MEKEIGECPLGDGKRWITGVVCMKAAECKHSSCIYIENRNMTSAMTGTIKNGKLVTLKVF